MAVVPSDLLNEAEAMMELAASLPDIPRREVLCRATVSRAYYAAFHAALDAAKRQGYSRSAAPPEFGSHETIWEWWFGEERQVDEIAREGSALKWERVRADYRLREHFTVEGARRAAESARRIMVALRDLA